MWPWRRLIKISWIYYVNKQGGVAAAARREINGNAIHWIGHTLRGTRSCMRTVREGRIEGKNAPGRPRDMMSDWMLDKRSRLGYKKIKEGKIEKNGVVWLLGLSKARTMLTRRRKEQDQEEEAGIMPRNKLCCSLSSCLKCWRGHPVDQILSFVLFSNCCSLIYKKSYEWEVNKTAWHVVQNSLIE